ncbi:C69 family dipeptidase [Acetilactobacillus jinshanensis]|uniref:Dipeptidase n=1 Tax=Acetilactobacillus jinshanensis TaxID=1720083 RepID=A0A4P6ZKS6_9LACO|nr:C69 family dipeptidase [Acetilactobacillus jinshanensis]QBP18356.1 C69 family dipeptidase [Acetilactobacillus jinshanensis]URL61221.1 C69 family dipeptidase [uncultured bacterium]
MKKDLACTAILIGKDATVDGSTIVARNEDGYGPVGPKRFIVRPARDKHHNMYVSHETGAKIPLPVHAYRYTTEPSEPSTHPTYEEAGINEKNVAMSSTETTYSNQRFLGCDPLVKHGSVNEGCMLTVVLPYINSAREGVKRLGKLIETYGTGQSNGIAFSDHNEVWYMETAGGHHWVAVRIPDDSYAIAPNQINIQDIDFHDPKNYMFSNDLPEFVRKNHLNLSSDPKEFNFRNIAGTHTEADAHYNTPRAWYGHLLFSPKQMQKLGLADKPTSQNIPFIMKPEHKMTVDDVEYFLSSHYQQTPYDPFTHKNELKKQTFRSIALDRNQISHILQIRNGINPQYAAIEWIALGFFAYSPYVPFYANILKTPENYATAGNHVSMRSAYWMYKILSVIVEPHYHHFINEINTYRKACQAHAIHRIKVTDSKVKNKSLNGKKLTEFLTKASDKTADQITHQTKEVMGSLVKQALNLSDLHFESGDNL